MNTKERDAIASLAFDAGIAAKRAAEGLEAAILSNAEPARIPRMRHLRTGLLKISKQCGNAAQVICSL